MLTVVYVNTNDRLLVQRKAEESLEPRSLSRHRESVCVGGGGGGQLGRDEIDGPEWETFENCCGRPMSW